MASTYENDLRLEEMATGENSGSWGTKTNTNLELVADAFSYGTEIIADADTAITIADGAADAARSLALKINSSEDLTTTRVVTLGPNTTSKVWIIENNTSGGQTLTISAGSGSNITLVNGTTKIIATDGIGAGSNVVELTQDIAIADLFVDDDLTVGDDIIMDSDGAKIDFGADSEIQLTHVADTGLLLTETGGGAPTLQIRDSALSLSSSADGQLDIDADTEVQITAPTVDINASTEVNISGDLTVDTDTLYVDSTNNRVGINESTPLEALHITTSDSGTTISKTVGNTSGPVLVLDNTDDTTNNLAGIQFASSGSSSTDVTASTGIYSINTGRGGTYSYGEMAFYTTTTGGAHTESFRVDSSQRVLIGTDSTRGTYGLTVAEPSDGIRVFGIASGGMDAIHFDQARGSVASPTASNADGDGSYLSFSSYDGTNFDDIGSLAVVTDGAQDSGRIIFRTTPTGGSQSERMRITSGGLVGINAVPTDYNDYGDGLVVRKSSITGSSGITVQATANTGYSSLYFGDPDDTKVGGLEYNHNTDGMSVQSGNATTMFLDSSQRVLIKHTTAQTFSLTPQLSVLGTDASSSAAQVGRFQNGAFASYYQFAKSRSTSIGSHVIVQDGDTIGNLRALADDGVNYDAVAASIEFVVDGTPDTNDMPGRIMFSTSVSGSDSPTERMRINSSGMVIINNGDVSTGTGTNKALLQVANIDTTSDWTAINTGANGYASTANEIAVLNTANQDLNGFAGIFFQAGENSNGSAINAARIGAIKTSTSGTSTDLGFATRDSSAVMAERMRITYSGGIIFQGPTPAGSTAIASGTLGSTNTFAELAGSGGSGTMVLSRGTTSNDAEIGSLRYVNRTNSSDSGLGSTGRLIAGISVRSVTSDSNAGGDSGSTMKFYTKPEAGSYAERLTIASGGNVTVKTGNLIIGTSGQGIDFSATGDGSGTDTSELLDDYEEGTWTPTADAGITGFSIQSATYTKVGRMVTLMFYVTSPSGNSGSNLQIGGLPYTPASQNYSTGWVECNTNGHMGMARVNSSNTYLSFFYPDASTSQRVSLTGNDVGSSHILGSITYQTSG